MREHELDEEKAEADANNSNALADELAERRRTLEQWSVAAYGEVRFAIFQIFAQFSDKPPTRLAARGASSQHHARRSACGRVLTGPACVHER